MKFKRFLLSLLLLVSSIALVGCTQGPVGEQGEKGPKGDNGLNGEEGDKGLKGDKGDDGSQGSVGEKGPNGDVGDKGESGDYLVFRTYNGFLQQKYSTEDDSAWENVLDLTTIMKYKYKYTLTLDANGGKYADEKQQVEWKEQVYGTVVTLPTPSQEGLVFVGWISSEQIYEAGEFQILDNVTLVAKWLTSEEKAYPKAFELHATKAVVADATLKDKEVAGIKFYNSLDAAIEAAEDNDVIYVDKGEWTLSKSITKKVSVYGINAGIKATGAEENVSKVVVAADSVKINSSYFLVDGLEIEGSQSSSSGGVYFVDTDATDVVIFRNSSIHKMNTTFKYQTGKGSDESQLRVEGCKVYDIGQFFVWLDSKSKTKNLYFIGNDFDISGAGAVVSGMASLFRVRSGNAYIYNNVFKGDPSDLPGWFDASASDAEYFVKYNTFEKVTKFVRIGNGKEIVFDYNVYKDASGNVLEAVPATVTGTGVVADANLCKSEEARQEAYQAFLNATSAE